MKTPKICPQCRGKLITGKRHKDGEATAVELVCKDCKKRYASIDMKVPVEDTDREMAEDLEWKKFLEKTPLPQIRLPISGMVLPDSAEVDATDMGKYEDIFFSLESSVFSGWNQNPKLLDNDVIESFSMLLKDLDNQPEGKLSWLLETSLKARLLFRERSGQGKFSIGEVNSCIKLLLYIAKEHENRTGDGYLRWVKTFFTTGLPETPEEHLEYLYKNEI